MRAARNSAHSDAYSLVCIDFFIAPIIGANYNASKIGTSRWGIRLSNTTIDLANSIWWHPQRSDKVYMQAARISLIDSPFYKRQVTIRIEDGPDIDLSICDMDQIVSSYLTLRGLEMPAGLGESKKPDL